MKKYFFAAFVAASIVIIIVGISSNEPTSEVRNSKLQDEIAWLSQPQEKHVLTPEEILEIKKEHVKCCFREEGYRTEEKSPEGYAQYETRVSYSLEIKGDSVYFIPVSYTIELVSTSTSKCGLPSGPVEIETPAPIALSDIEI